MKLAELNEGVIQNVKNYFKNLLKARDEKKTGEALLKNKNSLFDDYLEWTYAEIRDADQFENEDERKDAFALLDTIKVLRKKGNAQELGAAVHKMDAIV